MRARVVGALAAVLAVAPAPAAAAIVARQVSEVVTPTRAQASAAISRVWGVRLRAYGCEPVGLELVCSARVPLRMCVQGEGCSRAWEVERDVITPALRVRFVSASIVANL